jgi:hypothetical protein
MTKMAMRVCSLAAIVASTVAWGADGTAASRRLDCVLTDTPAKPQSENRAIVVVFDEDAGTLTAEVGSYSHRFAKVSISSATVNGQADGVSLGIDRSSLGIVWQQYDGGKVHTEYGLCQTSESPT